MTFNNSKKELSHMGKHLNLQINCIEVQDKPVTSTTELKDGVFYINFLKLL